MVRFDTLCLSLTIALSVLGVGSQSPPSPPHCVSACSDSSAQSASCSSTDVHCICNSDVFANDVASCIVSNCSSTDAAAAIGYFEALCSRAASSSVSFSGIPSTGSFSTTASGPGSVTSTTSSSGPTSSSSPSSSPSSRSGLSSSTNSAERSSVSSTTSGASQSSTSRITASSTSAASATPSTTPPVSHAVRGHSSMSFAGAGFAVAVAVAFVAW